MTAVTDGQEGKRATITDVARLAGVSRSTVSNALNQRPGRMARATAERIEEAAKALRYVPDGLARQLKRGHADIIGLIVPSVANPFWGEFVRRRRGGGTALELRGPGREQRSFAAA